MIDKFVGNTDVIYTEGTRGIRMLPTPDNQGAFLISEYGIYELSCDTIQCKLEKSSLNLRYNRPHWPVAMYIGEEVANCS